MSEMRQRLSTWGTISREVLIMRCTPLMPPGYAWYRFLIDTKKISRSEWESGDAEPPEPTMDDLETAQRALVLWVLRQLRRSGWLVEEGGKISLRTNEEERKALLRVRK
jgi:hypothetical protein